MAPPDSLVAWLAAQPIPPEEAVAIQEALAASRETTKLFQRYIKETLAASRAIMEDFRRSLSTARGRYYWARVLALELSSGVDPDAGHHELVRIAVGMVSEGRDRAGGPELATWVLGSDGQGLRDRWARELMAAAAALIRPFGWSERTDPAQEASDCTRPVETSDGPILWADAAAADWLAATYGEAGAFMAARVREEARERWDLVHGTDRQRHLDLAPTPPGQLWAWWCAPGSEHWPLPDWLVDLARVLWAHRWHEIAEEARDAAFRRMPAVVLPLFPAVAPAFFHGTRIVSDSSGSMLVGRGDDAVARLELGALSRLPAADLAAVKVLAQGGKTPALSSMAAYRLVTWAARTAHGRALEGEPDARVLTVSGWAGLCDALDMRQKDYKKVRDAALLLDSLRFNLPDGSVGGLLSLRYWHPDADTRGGAPARVELTVLSPLLPNFGFNVARGNRALVPLLPLPPMVGSGTRHGRQAGLWWATLAELRHRARELVDFGGVELSAHRWAELAAGPGLKLPAALQTVDRWTHDGDDGPAVLELVDGSRYRLADRDAHAFMVEGATREIEGARDGRRSAARRASGQRHKRRRK